MKYMGSKARFASSILPIILRGRKSQQWYVEPFAGGMNTICHVNGNRIANDVHPELIAMWQALLGGWIPPKYTREQHKDVRINKAAYPKHVVGWVGFNCSYSGVYFGGYAGETLTKEGTIRDYQAEAIQNVMRQVYRLQGVVLSNTSYDKLEIPSNSIIYCDPPYEGTSKYKVDSFDHPTFWNWVRGMVAIGHTCYVSEYNAPDDFECIWQVVAKSSLSANGKHGANKESVEKLFRMKDTKHGKIDNTIPG